MKQILSVQTVLSMDLLGEGGAWGLCGRDGGCSCVVTVLPISRSLEGFIVVGGM